MTKTKARSGKTPNCLVMLFLMQWHAAPVALMAGVSGYAAILFLGLYLSLANLADDRSRREYLAFALTCCAMLSYDMTCVGLYDARSIAQGFFWNRGNVLTAACVGIAYQRFTWDFMKRSLPWPLKIGGFALAVLGPIVSFWESPLTLTAARPAIKHMQFLGRDLIYYEVEAGTLYQVMMLVFFAVYLANVSFMFRYFRARSGREQRGRLGVLVAMIVSGSCAANDALVSAGVYTSVYAFEYGITAVLMAMGYVLLMRFGALHEVVNALNRDLSKTNADLVVALEQALESARSKTEFLASISHELRTPLNAIINLPEGLLDEFSMARLANCEACHAEFMLDDADVVDASSQCLECGRRELRTYERLEFRGEPTRAHSCLRTVARASRHLLGLVNDILDASKLELGRTLLVPTTIDLVELATEVVASAQAVADERDVTLRMQAPSGSDITPIVADRVRIGQVLYNLIGNAIKFSSPGGSVEVSICAPSKAERVICVRDHGIGIAAEHHQIIFEKFRQVDGGATRAHGGTGLGLAISKGLVELHGGRILVESERGQGSAFFVQLPEVPMSIGPALDSDKDLRA